MFKKINVLLTLFISLKALALDAVSDFYSNYEICTPFDWQAENLNGPNELRIISPKHSCEIHIVFSEQKIDKKLWESLAFDYQKALADSLSYNQNTKFNLKIETPKSYSLNNFKGYEFDYVNFFKDGRYLSGQSIILFGSKGEIAIDLISHNYKTRQKCLNDAHKYLKTLKERVN